MVTIIDRTGESQEIEYDKIIYSFRGKTTQVLPLEVATYLFNTQNPRYWVHTTDGEYVRRYGVMDAPDDWVTDVGADVLETAPLMRDAEHVEGWNTDKAIRATIDLKKTVHRPRAGEYENQGRQTTARS